VTTSRQEARGQRRDPLPSHELRVTLAELTTWGEELGRRVSPGSIIALQGELGTGKTTLAQAICRGVGIREDVTSPTFALVNEYQLNGSSLFHLDLYRLAGPADLTNIAWDDIINSGSIVIVEWPERAGDRMPDEAMRIQLNYVPGDDTRRTLTVG
jgi:tRNA threonylcarbamoyladenosine biosynthesis protein TsaE